jgi:hypothetical protein
MHLAETMGRATYLGLRVAAFLAGLVAPHDERSRLRRLVRFADGLEHPFAVQYFMYRRLFGPADLPRLLTDDFLAEADAAAPADWFCGLYEDCEAETELERAQRHDLATYLPDDLLVKADIASMAASLELRAPMLDHRVVALGLSLPPAAKVAGGRGKVILREAFADMLPGEVWRRPKRGFAVPLDRWLREDLLDVLKETLLDRSLRERGVFVDSVSPSRFEFTVDEVAAAVMPVRVDAGSLELADARVEPTEVEVWLRRGDLESLHEAERVIEVEMEEALSTAPRNQMLRFSDVPLRRRVGEFEVLRVEPQVVDVSLRVVSERVRRSLERIPVRLEVNPQLLERYRVERADANEWLLKLDVEGDQTVVAALRPQQVRAFVPLTSDEVLPAGQFRSVEVVIDLPEGVTLIGPPRLVQVRLVPREGTAP